MSDPKKPVDNQNRILGSLRDALLAAGRSDNDIPTQHAVPPSPPAVILSPSSLPAVVPPPAAEVAKAAAAQRADQTMRLRAGAGPAAARTQLVRGRVEVAKTDFHQDPVVGWLVVVGGAGLGAFRPIYEGNNTIGRAKSQRIAVDFGDDTISSEEQAYIRYDSGDRSFLFVPNMAKTNVVSINSKKPTAAVPLSAMDVITMGRTQLAFVPFCGQDFDWSELGDGK